jgi:hypothetical protein
VQAGRCQCHWHWLRVGGATVEVHSDSELSLQKLRNRKGLRVRGTVRPSVPVARRARGLDQTSRPSFGLCTERLLAPSLGPPALTEAGRATGSSQAAASLPADSEWQ